MKDQIAVQEKIVEDIMLERDAQDSKWGIQRHSMTSWLVILGEEFGEVCKEVCDCWTKGDSPELRRRMRQELIQVAAVAVAVLEQLDECGPYPFQVPPTK